MTGGYIFSYPLELRAKAGQDPHRTPSSDRALEKAASSIAVGKDWTSYHNICKRAIANVEEQYPTRGRPWSQVLGAEANYVMPLARNQRIEHDRSEQRREYERRERELNRLRPPPRYEYDGRHYDPYSRQPHHRHDHRYDHRRDHRGDDEIRELGRTVREVNRLFNLFR